MAPKDIFINAPATMIVPGNIYLLGILNSKLADYFIRNLGVTRNGGYFEYKPMFVSQMPIPIPTSGQKRNIEQATSEILNKNRQAKSITTLDIELNNLIYNLYQLTATEGKYIDLAEI